MNVNMNALSDNCCVICLESPDITGNHAETTLKCGHVFGRSCIAKWTEAKFTCPLCRGDLTWRQLARFQEFREHADCPLHQRYIKLAVFSAAMTISFSPGVHFFGVVKLVSAITPIFLYLRTLDALNEWRSGEGGFRELLIEKYTPVVDSLGGVAAGVVISSVMNLL